MRQTLGQGRANFSLAAYAARFFYTKVFHFYKNHLEKIFLFVYNFIMLNVMVGNTPAKSGKYPSQNGRQKKGKSRAAWRPWQQGGAGRAAPASEKEASGLPQIARPEACKLCSLYSVSWERWEYSPEGLL